ncbi:MAG: hypothetical protein P3W96_007285 [Halomonas sp.]|nr:hypothetical protein [Halomonas sp.]MDM7481805.1 hypothetical protein [Halomonas sp.]
MALGLYDAAFATLGRLLGSHARASMTGVTLVAGFASTLGWPITAFIESEWGWRAACASWALAHVALGMPLNARLPKAERALSSASSPASEAPERPRFTLLLLAYCHHACVLLDECHGRGLHLDNLTYDAPGCPCRVVR